MQLWIHIHNNKIFENLETLLFGDDKKIAGWFMENFPGEIYENISPYYELQVTSVMQIKKVLGATIFKNIKGFYFGSDQCEFLIPTLEETIKAIEILKDFDKKYVSKEQKKFVFLTSPWGNLQIKKRILENLEYLNQNAIKINPVTKIVEIVINDFGTLNLLKNYSNLKPIIGRLFVKTLKNPIVDTFGLENNVHIAGQIMKNKSQNEIKQIKKQIAENQKKGFGRSVLNNKYFIKFLEKQGIDRTGIDYQKNYQSLYQDISNLNIDIYYPYALVFTGRLCDVSAIGNIKRGYYAQDSVCGRICQKYDINYKNFETVGYKVLQRGNSGFKTQIQLNLSNLVLEKYENRLIYLVLI